MNGPPRDWVKRLLPAGTDPSSVIIGPQGVLAALPFMAPWSGAAMVLATDPARIGPPFMRPIADVAPTTSPAGSSTWIQFNIAGAFGASADLTWDEASFTLSVGSVSGAEMHLWGGRLHLRTNADIQFYNGAETFSGVLDPDTLTGNRAWKLPDLSGTLALTSQLAALGSSGSSGALQVADGSGGFLDGVAATHAEDLIITDSSKGLVLTSPDSSTARITIDDADVLQGVTAHNRIAEYRLCAGSI